MKIQSKTSEPRLEIGKELLSFVPMLEANDRVVRIAHDDHVAGGASLPPLVDPLIIDMMEVDVRQERADDRALRRPLAMPSGRCLPSAFGIYFRSDGSARYAPVWTRACRSRRF